MGSDRDELAARRIGNSSRRQLIADAALTVLAAEGGRGLTHRAVDREAHVPEGTTKNYYPTRQSLLEAAATRMTERHHAALDRLRATTPPQVSPSQLRKLYPALLHRATQDDPTHTLAMLELYLEAVRTPAVRAAVAEMAVANAQATAELHRSAGLNSDSGLLDACLLGAMITRIALPTEALHTIALDSADLVGAELFDALVESATQPHLAVQAR